MGRKTESGLSCPSLFHRSEAQQQAEARSTKIVFVRRNFPVDLSLATYRVRFDKWIVERSNMTMLWIFFSMWRLFRWTDKDAPWPKIEKKCHHIQSNKCILVHEVENLWDWKSPIFHKLQKRLSENATLVLYLDSCETKQVGILYEIMPIIFIYLFDFFFNYWSNIE